MTRGSHIHILKTRLKATYVLRNYSYVVCVAVCVAAMLQHVSRCVLQYVLQFLLQCVLQRV